VKVDLLAGVLVAEMVALTDAKKVAWMVEMSADWMDIEWAD